MNWSPTELAVADHLEAGTRLDLRKQPDPQRQVRADVIRTLLLGRRPATIHTGLGPEGDPKKADRTTELVTFMADPGGLSLWGANIVGEVNLENVISTVGLQLRHCTIPDGMIVSNAKLTHLDLDHSTLGRTPDPSRPDAFPLDKPALDADHLNTANFLRMNNTTAHAATEIGTIRLMDADVGAGLSISQATITNSKGSALNANLLNVQGTAFLSGTLAGAGEDGTIRLCGAQFGGQLTIAAKLTNLTGPALDGDGLAVATDMFLVGEYSGDGDDAAAHLLNANIGGEIEISAKIINTSGPALQAEGIRVAGDASVTGALTGFGVNGTLGLNRAQFGSLLDISRAQLINANGPSLTAKAMKAIDLSLGNLQGQINLTRATVTGDLDIVPAPGRTLLVDGLTYHSLSGTGWREWLAALRESTPTYAAQPYRQLATITGASGHDSDTREILVTQRKDQLKRATLSTPTRTWGWFTGWSLGYGYRSGRMLLALIVISAVTACIFWLSPAGATGLHLKDTPAACPSGDRILLGIDTAIPLVTTPVTTTCVATSTAPGRTITALGAASQMLGWATATLFVAGFTSAVRKT